MSTATLIPFITWELQALSKVHRTDLESCPRDESGYDIENMYKSRRCVNLLTSFTFRHFSSALPPVSLSFALLSARIRSPFKSAPEAYSQPCLLGDLNYQFPLALLSHPLLDLDWH